MLKFISFSSLSSAGLDDKVNNFLKSNPKIEVIEMRFAASFGSV